MGVAITLENFLKTRDVGFDLIAHRYCEGSYNTAFCAEIPPQNLAKGVVFRDEDFHYVMAIVPANNRVLRHTLNTIFDRKLELAEEEELEDLFFDCAPGAIPSLGQAYGLHVIWDEQLQSANEVWMEAGDHEHLVHLRQEDFERLMLNDLHDIISANRQQVKVKKRRPRKSD